MLITISIKLTQIVVLGIPVPVPVPFCEVFIIFTLFFIKLGIIPIIVTILRDFWNHFKILVSARVPHLLPIFYTLHPCSPSSLNFSVLFPWVFFSWYFPESYIGDIFRFQFRWLSMLAEDRAQAAQIWRFSQFTFSPILIFWIDMWKSSSQYVHLNLYLYFVTLYLYFWVEYIQDSNCSPALQFSSAPHCPCRLPPPM